MITHADVRALRGVIEEARIILSTTALPAGRAVHAKELIESAVKQADALLTRPTLAMQAKRGHARVFVRG
jgi:hypothetical protein